MKHLWLILFTSFSLAWAQDSTFYEKGKIAAQEDITKIEVNIKRMGFISGLVGIGGGIFLSPIFKTDKHKNYLNILKL